MGYGYPFGYGAARAAAGGGEPPAPTLGTPIAIASSGVNGSLNVTVTDQGGGVYRIAKTSGTDEVRNARANSVSAIDGDCLITISGVIGWPEDPVGLEAFVGLNDAALTNNSIAAIEAAWSLASLSENAGGDATVVQPPGTIVIGSGLPLPSSIPLYVQRIGTTLSFRKGATWATSTEVVAGNAPLSGPLFCSISLLYLGSAVDVTFQPIVGA